MRRLGRKWGDCKASRVRAAWPRTPLSVSRRSSPCALMNPLRGYGGSEERRREAEWDRSALARTRQISPSQQSSSRPGQILWPDLSSPFAVSRHHRVAFHGAWRCWVRVGHARPTASTIASRFLPAATWRETKRQARKRWVCPETVRHLRCSRPLVSARTGWCPGRLVSRGRLRPRPSPAANPRRCVRARRRESENCPPP